MTGHLLGARRRGGVDRGRARAVPPARAADDQPRRPDDEVGLDVVRGEPRPLRDGEIAALNNSFGFGGHNVALAFRSVLMTDCRALPDRCSVRRSCPGRRSAQSATTGSPPSSTPGTCRTDRPDDDSGMLAASGSVDGAPVVAFASDATVQGGAMGDRRAAASSSPRTSARSPTASRSSGCGTPAVPGSREGVLSLHAVGQIFAIMTRASGRIPQISVVLGPAAGGAAYGPALTDVVDPRSRGPSVRHRPRRRPIGHRRGRRHAAAGRPGAARSPVRRRPRRRRAPSATPSTRPAGSPRCSAPREHSSSSRSRTATSAACCRSRLAGLRRAPVGRRPARLRLGARAAPEVGRRTSSRRSAGSAGAPSA